MKFKSLIIVPLMALSLCSCGNSEGNSTSAEVNGPKKIEIQLSLNNYKTYLNVKEEWSNSAFMAKNVIKISFEGAIHNGIYDDAIITYRYMPHHGYDEKQTVNLSLTKSGCGETDTGFEVEVVQVSGLLSYWN